MPAIDPLSAILGLGTAVIERVFPNPQDAANAKLKLLEMQQSGELAQLTASSSIITAEVNSQSWITRNWRPILMLTFGALIVARWLGWTAPNLTEAEYLKLWDIVQIGIGGYTIGRSVESVATTVAQAIKK
jgi:Holin of 3TMs, for gene-transfer release